MRLLEPDREADVYAISCELRLTRIGVAADARERLRAMQVGSPLPLELAGRYHYRSADEAYAAAADLRRQARHVRVDAPQTSPSPRSWRRASRRTPEPSARTIQIEKGRPDGVAGFSVR
jgi:hypothetical protein